MAEMNVLHADSLSVGYGKTIIVDDLTFTARRGELLTIIGPNGAGKTTVLRSIAAQLPCLGGSVMLGGRTISSLSPHEIAQQLSVCFTERITGERMTCEDIAATGRYPYTGHLGILSAQDRRIVREAMEQTGTAALADTDIRRISDGQRQTVMLARAIAQEPQVLLLDEPTSFLDINNKLRLLTLLRSLAQQKQIAVVQTLHELDLAQRFSDQILCVRDGKADRIGTPEEIFAGDYISRLYAISSGSFEPLYGTAEGARIAGKPQVFVIGGGGSGIPVYRRLQRKGIPFAAGVLHENDLDFPTAQKLAAELITEAAYEPIRPETLQHAREIMDSCEKVVCCLRQFGTMNAGNQALLEAAQRSGRLTDI